jgi:hypothetical protein
MHFNAFLYSAIVSHAGDGNFHTIIMFDPANQEQSKEAVRLSEFMVYTALSMDGKGLYYLLNIQCIIQCMLCVLHKTMQVTTARNLEMAFS